MMIKSNDDSEIQLYVEFNYMYMLDGICPSTQHLCFGVTRHCTLCNTHERFCGKSCITLE